MKSKKTKKRVKKFVPVKGCFFCTEKKEPWYSDTEILRKYVSDRGKIMGGIRTGICAKHQRRLTASIKHARHLAMLPFVGQR